jgi:hypothetical protein
VKQQRDPSSVQLPFSYLLGVNGATVVFVKLIKDAADGVGVETASRIHETAVALAAAGCQCLIGGGAAAGGSISSFIERNGGRSRAPQQCTGRQLI